MDDSEDRSRYEAQRDHGERALRAGELEQALRAYDQALAEARQLGDPELLDRALCNCAAVRITLGEVEEPLGELRRILMANGSAENCILAAYNIARAHELRKDVKKGLFYARIARDRAEIVGREDWLASAHNQIANFLVAESFFDEAMSEYVDALALMPAHQEAFALTIQLNLGYCHLMKGRLSHGLDSLYRCLRRARRAGLGRLEMIAHLDLTLGLLERERHDLAWKHGRLGLSMAEASGDADWIKNGLYLVGEVAILGGEAEEAYERFGELQQRFYPNQPFVRDFLMSVDVRPLINLRA